MVVAKLTAHRLLPVAGLLALLVFTWWLRPGYSGGLLYKWAREAGRRQAWFLTRGEFFYIPLSLRLGYTPANKILLILYPDCQSLRNVFGWPDGEDALGVYWGGVIRLLSPRAWDWLEPDRSLAEEFMSNGPLAHELTHYLGKNLRRGPSTIPRADPPRTARRICRWGKRIKGLLALVLGRVGFGGKNSGGRGRETYRRDTEI